MKWSQFRIFAVSPQWVWNSNYAVHMCLGLGNSRNYPYIMTDGFLEFRGQVGGSLNWNSEGMGGMLTFGILWTLPVRKWSTAKRHDTDDDHESAGYRRSIDQSGMCWRKPIKLELYIRFMNFLMMNIRLIKYEQIVAHVILEYSVNPGDCPWT